MYHAKKLIKLIIILGCSSCLHLFCSSTKPSHESAFEDAHKYPLADLHERERQELERLYYHFFNQYPKAISSDSLRIMLEPYIFDKIQENMTIHALEQFLNSYPEGDNALIAKRQIDSLSLLVKDLKDIDNDFSYFPFSLNHFEWSWQIEQYPEKLDIIIKSALTSSRTTIGGGSSKTKLFHYYGSPKSAGQVIHKRALGIFSDVAENISWRIQRNKEFIKVLPKTGLFTVQIFMFEVEDLVFEATIDLVKWKAVNFDDSERLIENIWSVNLDESGSYSIR